MVSFEVTIEGFKWCWDWYQ